jgi:hypothetical protein
MHSDFLQQSGLINFNVSVESRKDSVNWGGSMISGMGGGTSDK